MPDASRLNIELLVDIGHLVVRRALDPDDIDIPPSEAMEWLAALYEVARIGCRADTDGSALALLQTALNSTVERKGR